ncbi:MAG TPA: DUF808 domain-containing protein [Pedomonas sp.]|uniref:DUF808 domain-containing protein n=1 Tax=Pedomonas sp. TaxID=2976421 RepID=UPI002F41E411
MSGLLALLDDVAAIAKIAAASVDDIAAGAGKASTKALGVVIDDAAVTPKYVSGLKAARELPMIGRIAWGSLKNKAILLPLLIGLDLFLPQAITVLLMLGGAYLAFEGAEKVWHVLNPHDEHAAEAHDARDPTELEEERVLGAIKTDFILSAEIMTLSLSVIESPSIWMQLLTLAVVGILITVGVYGAVALIVKLDDMGVLMARKGRFMPTRRIGRLMVKGVPKLLWLLSVVGTAAMLWVGGSIFIHALHGLGLHEPYGTIHHLAEQAAAAVPPALTGFTNWTVTALCDGLFGLALGLLLIPVTTKLITPLLEKLWAKVRPAG